MPGIKIDGNNVLEVYEASQEAIDNARGGRGPSLIECRTYRWRAHVGWPQDYDVGFRTKEEVKKWEKRCPIKAFEKFLAGQGVLSESEKSQISEQIDREIEEALTFARESPFPDESELLEGVYR